MTTERFMKHAASLVVTTFFLASCFFIESANATGMESKRQKEFVELFDYEIQNRAFARIALQRISENEENLVKKAFWDAYLALESLNQDKYAPFARKYELTQEPGFLTSFKASMLVFSYNWFPSYTLKTMHKATVKHVGKLEEMAALAGKEDKTFAAYVVSQEKIQAQAFLLMVNGKDQQAAKLIADFVAEHDSNGLSENRHKDRS